MKVLFSLCLIFLFSFPIHAQEIPLFEEINGLVIIEAESAQAQEFWIPETSISRYTGANYLHYKGSNLFNSPGLWKLSYQVNISTTGKYRFQWRSRIAIGDSNTEHNDSWLRFPDAAKFYAQRPGSTVWPRGSGMTPPPNGSSAGGWFKVYQNVRNDWTWNTSTSDHDPHPIFVEFDSAGIYTIEISGRSNGHAIDRLSLYHSSVSSSLATNTSTPESPQLSTSIKTPILASLDIFPNPAKAFIRIQLPNAIDDKVSHLQISDTYGKWVYTEKGIITQNGVLYLDIDHFPVGQYFIFLQDEQQGYHGRFIKW